MRKGETGQAEKTAGGIGMSDIDEHVENSQEKANGKFAQLVDKMVEGKVPVPLDMDTMIWHYKQLLDTEKEFEYKISLIVRKESIYRNYLNHIKGIGPVFAALTWAQSDLNRRPSGYEPDAPPD
jgi:hypothetical protein